MQQDLYLTVLANHFGRRAKSNELYSTKPGKGSAVCDDEDRHDNDRIFTKAEARILLKTGEVNDKVNNKDTGINSNDSRRLGRIESKTRCKIDQRKYTGLQSIPIQSDTNTLHYALLNAPTNRALPLNTMLVGVNLIVLFQINQNCNKN